MTTLYTKAEFCFMDKDGEIAWGEVGWIKSEWDGAVSDEEKDRMNFAYKVAEDYLKPLMKVEFEITYIIALKKGEL